MGQDINNYFRAGKTPFFFNDKDTASTALAWEQVSAFVAEMRSRRTYAIGVYRPILVGGPWQRAKLIGEGDLAEARDRGVDV